MLIVTFKLELTFALVYFFTFIMLFDERDNATFMPMPKIWCKKISMGC